MHRRIEPGAEQRADQQFRLLPRDFACVGRGVDHRPDAIVRQRLALALRGNPFNVRRHLRERRPTQLVVGAEHVEHRRRIGKEMLAALAREADRVRQHHHWVDLGAVGYRVEAKLARKLLRELSRGVREARAQTPHHRRRQGAIEHGARAIMLGRVALQDQARRPPRLLALKVAQAHAAA